MLVMNQVKNGVQNVAVNKTNKSGSTKLVGSFTPSAPMGGKVTMYDTGITVASRKPASRARETALTDTTLERRSRRVRALSVISAASTVFFADAMSALARFSMSAATSAGEGGSGAAAASRSCLTARGVRAVSGRDPERVLRSSPPSVPAWGSGVVSAPLLLLSRFHVSPRSRK